MPYIELEINLDVSDASGEVIHLRTVDELMRFIEQEARFWIESQGDVAESTSCHNFLNIGHSFNELYKHLENNVLNSSMDQTTMVNKLRQLFQHFISPSSWVWSGHDYVDRFIEINKDKGKEVAHAFYHFLVRSQVANINQKAGLEGVLLAYEYNNQDSNLVKRSKTERRSIARIRGELVRKNREVIKEISDTSRDIENWLSSKQNEVEGTFVEYKAKSEQFFRVNKKLSEKKADKFDRAATEMFSHWDEKLEGLEQKHHEKLQFAKPATYWKNAAKAHGRRGVFASLLISLVIMASLIGLSEFFTIWLLNKEEVISLQSIQGAVIFASMAALVAFIVKVLARLAFSSFHLMRDAEEREQLTYLYLSLTDQEVLDESARDIVLQALFSRSETGLLNQESGPSMPGSHEALKSVFRSN